MNKKGGEKYLTFWLFLFWIIIAIPIIAATSFYYSARIDIRSEEADILATRLADCIIDNGYLKDLEGFDVFAECNLNQKVINEDFYLDVQIKSNNQVIIKIEEGDSNLVFQCGIKSSEEHFAECDKKVFYALNQSNPNQMFALEIEAASNQQG